MSVYPFELDDDSTIIRVDDNVSEISGQNFNQVRDAVFKIEEELGIKPSGTLDSLKQFLDVSFDTNGTIKASALASVGLVTLPIDNAQVGTNAGILESKLSLDYSTSSLRSLIASNASLINALQTATNGLTINLNSHIGGGSAAVRHVVSHIDLNAVPSDSRDPTFFWGGLVDTSGAQRSATNTAEALEQINNELVGHENSILNSHSATSISVDTSSFSQISEEATNVQLAINELDASEDLRIGIHRSTMHSAGVPADARSSSLFNDGYGDAVVSSRAVQAYVAAFPGTVPVDDVSDGDTIVRFIPPADPAELNILDSQFSQVKPGDILRIIYGDGYNFEAQYIIESLRYIPGTEYFVRLDANNLVDTTDAYARIDRPLYDPNVYGVAIAAPCNATPLGDFPGFLSSITIADPRCASVLGIGFDSNQIDATHYKLYLQLYPTGNPAEKAIVMPAIDISGNSGATPGQYTLDSVILATNNAFRQSGYNLRFLAFQYAGNFGISLTDPFDKAAFSIITGDWSSGTGTEGSFTENVIGDFNVDGKDYDALGLSAGAGNWASPAYRGSYVDATDAQNPTKVIMPRKQRYYVANGSARDFLRSGVGVFDGYWLADITARTVSGVGVETTYTIYDCLNTVGLKPGKTITVLPNVGVNDGYYNSNDYGRFIIKEVVYQPACGATSNTIITVVNGIHATGNASSSSTGPGTGIQVRIHFGNDTVGFDLNHMIDGSTPSAVNYHRLHEIYVNKDAKTLSHERARMPIQGASGTALDTTYWHLNYVSPKLRGYRDNTADFNKYLRLIITSYDNTSGEFTAQIGQRTTVDTIPPTTITLQNTGKVATGRKNVPVKIFDETGNDYIEIEFVETSSSSTVITPNRVVDIELFPTLMTDDELTLIATCEMNWQTSGYLVERVRDRRQVGSISETEFTQSAVSFITSGDRALHANGIIRDLECLGVSPTDSASLLFNGGMALVNGNIVSANNGRVVIPELVETGGGPGSTVDWVVCLDESGDFITLPLTATKTQFFAEAGTGGGTAYYIPSITFSELINNRKDLVPLTIITATIASVTISDIRDVRKFVENESANIPLVWCEDETNTSASFRSGDAFKNYISNITNDLGISSKQKVIVKGDITLSTMLDLTSIPNLILEGEGPEAARIIVNSTVGIKLNSNATIKNIQFTYSPSVLTTNRTNISLSTPLGCVVIQPTPSTTVSNINIDNCDFIGTGTPYRSPFIYMLLNNNIVENCSIVKNSFSDSFATTSAAIVIAEANTDGLVHSVLNNVFIDKNICAQEQGIFITGTTSSSLAPITTINSHISKNKCGYIGVITGSNIDPENSNNQYGLTISKNSCYRIFGPIDVNGSPIANKAIGNVLIKGNTTSLINFAYTSTATPRTGQSSIIVDGNTLIALSSVASVAIQLIDTAGSVLFPAKIINNTIMPGSTFDSATVLEYSFGIIASTPSVISNNTIVSFTSVGIDCNASGHTEATGSIITNNFIFRNGNSVVSYINGAGAGIITENYFDSTTVDGGTNEITIVLPLGRAEAIIVDRNINHIKTFYPKISHGTSMWLYGVYLMNHWNANPILWARYSTNNEKITLRYDSSISTAASTSRFVVPLKGLIPDGAKVISATFTGSASRTFDTTGNITLVAQYNTTTGAAATLITGTPLDFGSTGGLGPLTSTININRRVEENIEIDVLATLETTASTNIHFNLSVKYTF